MKYFHLAIIAIDILAFIFRGCWAAENRDPITVIIQFTVAAYLIRYTIETVRLRKASEQSLETSKQSLEASFRPILKKGKNEDQKPTIFNAGNGPAIDIRHYSWVRKGGNKEFSALKTPPLISILGRDKSYVTDGQRYSVQVYKEYIKRETDKLILKRIESASKLDHYGVQLILYYDSSGSLHESLAWGPETGINQTRLRKLT